MQWLRRISAVVIGLLPVVWVGGNAHADEGISLHITNDGTLDIYVSVTDVNSHAPIIEHQRLNGFATLPITATADDQGHANITWSTISVDNGDRHCGRGTRDGLENDATVTVRADSSC